MCAKACNLVPGEVSISFLPLSHIAAQLVDIYIPITCGAAVYFAQPDALKVSHVTQCDFDLVPGRESVAKCLDPKCLRSC